MDSGFVLLALARVLDGSESDFLKYSFLLFLGDVEAVEDLLVYPIGTRLQFRVYPFKVARRGDGGVFEAVLRRDRLVGFDGFEVVAEFAVRVVFVRRERLRFSEDGE